MMEGHSLEGEKGRRMEERECRVGSKIRREMRGAGCAPEVERSSSWVVLAAVSVFQVLVLRGLLASWRQPGAATQP